MVSRNPFGSKPRQAAASVLSVLLLVSMVACQPQSGGATDSGAAVAPAAHLPVEQADPESAARSLLAHLQAACAAAGKRQATVENQIYDRALPLYAGGPLTTRTAALARALIGDDLDRSVLKLWSRGIAYYAAGIELTSVRRVSSTSARARVVVGAAASRADERAVLLVTCEPGEDQRWRVARIEFAGRDEQEAFLRSAASSQASTTVAAESAPSKP